MLDVLSTKGGREWCAFQTTVIFSGQSRFPFQSTPSSAPEVFVKNPKRASTATAVKLPDFKHPQKAIADGLKTITIYGINEKTKCSYKSNKTFVAFRGILKSTYVGLITYGKFLLPRRTAWCESIYTFNKTVN